MDNKKSINDLKIIKENNKTDIIMNNTLQFIDKLIKLKRLQQSGRILNIISLSDDGASASYMNNKVKEGENYDVPVKIHKPINRYELHKLLTDLALTNLNNRVIIQKPFNENKWGKLKDLMNMIPSYMDVDGFTFNLLNLENIKHFDDMIMCPYFSPTAKGVLSIIDQCGDIKGKDVTVIGKGITSGMPIAMMCEQLGATVHWCNSKTNRNLMDSLIEASDFVISCAGVENIVNSKNKTSKYIKAHYINVGMSRGEDGKLKGDIDFDLSYNDNTVFCNKLFGTTGKLTTMCLILNTLL